MKTTFAERFQHVVVMAMLTALAFIQAPGKIVADTKIDLVIDPGRFLARATSLWEPIAAFGQTQNQAYGYLFPMGPFFALGWIADLPEWVIQRLWWAFIFVVAYAGMVILGKVLQMGSHWALMIGGLAYALSPRMISIIGPSSIEVWPMAVAPWVLIPLVLASRGRTPWAMAAASAVAVACVGGVNAVATFAVVPPAVLWILFMDPGRIRRRLMLWWPVFVLAGTLWWLVPLFLLGAYSPPFLDFIESSSLTTFSATLLDALRGTTNWTAYLSPTATAGRLMVSQSVVLLNLAVLVTVGVHGLCLRSTAHRRFLISCLCAGLVLVTLGHTASHGGWAAPQIQSLLDGSLSPLRNAHKFDVVVRLPLVLAMVAAIDHYARVAPARLRQVSSWPRRGVLLLAVVGVLGSTSPAWSGEIAPAGAFDSVPGYWKDAADWLGEQPDGAALLLQASSFASYDWGRVNDEPLQALATSPWAVRNAIPLTNPGTIRTLDVISQRMRDHDPDGAGALLRTTGVRYLVLRNDLASGLDDMRIELAYATIADLDDVVKVAAFGPRVEREPFANVGGVRTFYDAGWQRAHRAIEVYEVRGAPRGSATPSDDVPVVVGAAESVPGLFASGVVSNDAMTFAQDRDSDEDPGDWILTDGARRQEVAFGRVHSNRSASLTADEPYQSRRRVHDYVSPGDARWTSARDLRQAESITASSSTAWVDSNDTIDQSAQPWSAFDGDPGTAWRASSNDIGKPSWIQVDFRQPRTVSRIQVVLEGDPVDSTELTVTTDQEVVTSSVSGSLASTIDLHGETDSIRLSAPSSAGSLLAIRDVVVDGVTLTRPLVLPTVPDSWSAPRAIVLQAEAGYRSGCLRISGVLRCQPGADGWGEDGRSLDREFRLPHAATMPFTVDVEPIGGQDLDALIQRGDLATVSASSTVTRGSQAGVTNVIDGDPATAWVAATDDDRPTLRVSWLGERRVSQARLALDPRVAASRPDEVTLRFSDGSTVERRVASDGYVSFPARTSAWIEVSFDKEQDAKNISAQGRFSVLPVGVSEVSVSGLTLVRSWSAEPRHYRCGTGPEVSVNGATTRTRLVASPQQLRTGRGVRAVACGRAVAAFTAGSNRVIVAGNLLVRPVRVVFGEPAEPSSSRAVKVTTTPTRLTAPLSARSEPTVVRIAQNANEAWRAADADGRVVLNGWQQGWVVGPGESTEFVATVPSQGIYRTALVGGGVLAALLLLGAGIGWSRSRRNRPRSVSSRGAQRRRTAAVLVLGALTVGMVAGWSGLAIAAVGAAGTAAVARRTEAGWIPAALVGVVAVLSAAWPWGTLRPWFGTFDWPQLVLAGALGSLLALLMGGRMFRSR